MQRFDKNVFYLKGQDMMTTTQHKNKMGQLMIVNIVNHYKNM